MIFAYVPSTVQQHNIHQENVMFVVPWRKRTGTGMNVFNNVEIQRCFMHIYVVPYSLIINQIRGWPFEILGEAWKIFRRKKLQPCWHREKKLVTFYDYISNHNQCKHHFPTQVKPFFKCTKYKHFLWYCSILNALSNFVRFFVLPGKVCVRLLYLNLIDTCDVMACNINSPDINCNQQLKCARINKLYTMNICLSRFIHESHCTCNF